MSSARPPARAREGFVLPFVIVAISVLGLLSMTLVGESMQSIRAARVTMSADDADDVTEAAIAQALDRFVADSIGVRELGRAVTQTVSINGRLVVVRWQRHQPLFASLRAVVSDGTRGRWNDVARDRYRAVWLSPPAIPIPAAVSTNGTVTGSEGTLLSGSDVALPGSACGSTRDTASVAAVAAAGIAPSAPGSWPGIPSATAAPLNLLGQLQQAFVLIAQRAPNIAVGKTAIVLPVPTGVRARFLDGDTVTIGGVNTWDGLLAVRGHLRVTGTLRIRGLLLVLGSVDVTGATLAVQGALVSADTHATGVMLGADSQLFFDRCTTQMALATVSRPTLGPFSAWASLTPDNP